MQKENSKFYDSLKRKLSKLEIDFIKPEQLSITCKSNMQILYLFVVILTTQNVPKTINFQIQLRVRNICNKDSSHKNNTMAEIINYDPQDNPRLQQIYEILLLAGYFRIRIASLKAFDKVIGGIAWCITSSNFQIQVDYNDQMQIGQKIRVSEQICYALKNMKCPYDLQPFQLQGLDVNNIFPVVQWLIKFVYETRFERQKYNRQIALKQGRKIVNFGINGNPAIFKNTPKIKRTKINKAVMQTSRYNPIRVYSGLLQFNDMTSLRMYNKLHNMMLDKKQRQNKKATYNTTEQGCQQDQNKIQSDFLQIMNPDKQKQQNQVVQEQEHNLNLEQHFSAVGTKISLQKLQKIIQENKTNYETVLKETIQQGQTLQENLIKKVKEHNHQYEEQIRVLQSKLTSFESVMQKNREEVQTVAQKRQQARQKLAKRQQKYREIEDYGNQIQQELKSQKIQHANMEKLVDKKIRLKQRKAQVKKKAKAKIEEALQKKLSVQASMPQIDQQVFSQMVEQAQTKKQIYDRKYEQLTEVNQELAVLQRKAQNFTSAPQIAQYHQRFVQLFEAINLLIQEKRGIFGEMTNLEAIQKLVNNFKEFVSNAKQGVFNAKSKQHKKELAEDLREIYMGFEKNMNNSKLSYAKLQSNLENTYSQYSALVKFERQYMKKLRQLKIQYQNAQKIYQ